MKKYIIDFKDNFKIYLNYLSKNKLGTISRFSIYVFPIILIISDVSEYFNSHRINFILILMVLFIFHEYIEFEKMEKIAKMEKDLETSKKIIGNKETSIDTLGEYLSCIPNDIMKIISDELNLGNADRVSLYMYNIDKFQIIGRYSENPIYKEIGRKEYPGNEGYIAKCRNNDNGKPSYYKKNLPKNEEAYLEKVSSDAGISKDTISKISMRSRAYYCRLVQHYDKNYVGVLVIETTNSSLKFSENELNEYVDNLLLPYLHVVLDMNNKLL